MRGSPFRARGREKGVGDGRKDEGGPLTQRVRNEGASDCAGCQAARCAHHHLLFVAAALGLLLAGVLLRVLSLGIFSAVLRLATVPATIAVELAIIVPGLTTIRRRTAVPAAAITALAVSLRMVNGPLPLRAAGGGLSVVPAALVVVPLR